MSGPQPALRRTDIRNQRKRRRARPDSEPIRSSRSRREAATDWPAGVPAESGNRRTKTEAVGRMEEGRGSGRQSECVCGNMPDVQDGMTADGGPAGGGKKEAAGGRFGAREAAIRSNPPPSVRSVQRGRPPTAPRRTAEAQHAASVRAQAARPSAAPCQARRSGGRGVWERRAWRAGWLPQQPA